MGLVWDTCTGQRRTCTRTARRVGAGRALIKTGGGLASSRNAGCLLRLGGWVLGGRAGRRAGEGGLLRAVTDVDLGSSSGCVCGDMGTPRHAEDHNVLDPKACEITAFWTISMSFGPLFYILL